MLLNNCFLELFKILLYFSGTDIYIRICQNIRPLIYVRLHLTRYLMSWACKNIFKFNYCIIRQKFLTHLELLRWIYATLVVINLATTSRQGRNQAGRKTWRLANSLEESKDCRKPHTHIQTREISLTETLL
jgi:hypothetical protein